MTIPLHKRLEALQLQYEKYPDDCLQTVNRLCGMYMFSGTTLITEYIYNIAVKAHISNLLKLECAKILCECDFINNIELGFKSLDFVCSDMRDIPTPCQIEAVLLLMKKEDYNDNTLNYFTAITNNQELECDFRYKTILTLERLYRIREREINNEKSYQASIKYKYTTNEDIHIPNHFIYLLRESLIAFLYNTSNRTLYRILAAQYLLTKLDIDTVLSEKIERVILYFADDNELDYNLRADATDLLLNNKSGNKEIMSRAQDIILKLGEQFGKVRTIYDNAQNAHNNEVQESALEIVRHLSSFQLMKMNDVFITYDYVHAKILKLIKNNKNKFVNDKEQYDDYKKKIKIALNRILLDRILYTEHNYTLTHILLRLWTYIQAHEAVRELEQRLLQELYDLADICSTGFVDRLANVISGYGDYSIRISWEDQIVSNFVGRLNARARYLDTMDSYLYDKDKGNLILDKMRPVIYLYLHHEEQEKLLDSVITELCKKHEEKRKKHEEQLRKDNKKLDDDVQSRNEPVSDIRVTYTPNEKEIIDYFLTLPNCVLETVCSQLLSPDLEYVLQYIVKEFKDNVIVEMSYTCDKYHLRPNFLKFFRDNMLSIREEMYNEFREYMEDTDFDLFIRKALQKYDAQ